MATQRSTFGKRDREMAKAAKARAEARASRQPLRGGARAARRRRWSGTARPSCSTSSAISTRRTTTAGSRSKTSTSRRAELTDQIAIRMASESL